MKLRGGLGQIWATVRWAVRVLVLSQLASPLVAWLAMFVAGSAGLDTGVVPSVSDEDGQVNIVTTPTPSYQQVGSCCQEDNQPCPRDHIPDTSSLLCQEWSGPCSQLPLTCLSCTCDYDCHYGQPSNASCKVSSAELECEGDREFNREFRCSYCYLTQPSRHKCSNRNIGCRSVGSPTSRAHWYIANCTSGDNLVCLGRHVFSKKTECNWTEGYSWRTALVLSVTLGGFGADRFYLGHWQEGIGKLFSFGGLGVWTLVDVVLVSIGYIGPADGSLYI